jgi:hypothetical protein
MVPWGGELIRLQVLFSVTGFLLLVLTGFSPKSKSLHYSDFGDNLCQFM